MKNLLLKIVKDKNAHARWLNSLSYLEYRGFRKIARSQNTEDIDEDLLSHAMEEVRHALFFKKLAIKVGGSSFSYYKTETLLSEAAIKSYFYELDLNTAKLCARTGHSDKKSIYHCVTWLIEERAMQVYQEYDLTLKTQKFDFSLRPVLIDEIRHLDGVRNLVPRFFTNEKIKLESLFEIEAVCFKKLLAAFYAQLKITSTTELEII